MAAKKKQKKTLCKGYGGWQQGGGGYGGALYKQMGVKKICASGWGVAEGGV